MITNGLGQDNQIEVIGEACDPYDARDKILSLQPDVLTLDVEMPRMDGLTFLRIIQKHHPIPVIVISSLTHAGSKAALNALEAGAFDIMAKPLDSASVDTFRQDLAWRIKGAAVAKRRPALPSANIQPIRPGATGVSFHPLQLLLLGSSTGGIEALNELLPRLPCDLPPICVTQHVPAYISKAVAQRLNERCSFEVREAVDGDDLHPGLALIAPGDFHLTVARKGLGHCVRLTQAAKVNFCRPSVDVMFQSAAQLPGARNIAVLLTGMGCDGAEGMAALHRAGARTFAQDEASCVVYGMPRAAAELGVVDHLLPLSDLPAAILSSLLAMAK
jgi:two-component system chemotaxis response regulator CheB